MLFRSNMLRHYVLVQLVHVTQVTIIAVFFLRLLISLKTTKALIYMTEIIIIIIIIIIEIMCSLRIKTVSKQVRPGVSKIKQAELCLRCVQVTSQDTASKPGVTITHPGFSKIRTRVLILREHRNKSCISGKFSLEKYYSYI